MLSSRSIRLVVARTAGFDGPFEEVLIAATAGGGWAARQLYEWLAPAVSGYLRVQGAQEPDDLCSEVFLRVFRSLARFDGDAARFRSWVFSIAHNQLVDARRRQVVRERELPAPSPSARSSPAAEAAVLESLGTAEVVELLAGLHADQRTVLLLRIVGDLTIDQVATAVGKRPGAVKALQRRGLTALRRALTEEAVPL